MYGILVDLEIYPSYIITTSELYNYVVTKQHVFEVNTSNTILNTLVNSMLQYEPQNRSTAEELLSMYHDLSEAAIVDLNLPILQPDLGIKQTV